ncbi:MAG TPA: hypothetical protein VFT91_08215 [Dehalococcoidia bacterium]|nr:hypothetical protein [Dehalococcoidia bacterium]
MSTRIIVLVTDRDDPKHGEVTVLDDPRKAERLVETLLEAGFDNQRFRVFTGAEMDMQITHRPVVSLLGEDAAAEEEPQAEEAEAEPEAHQTEEAEEEEAATPFVQNGVRFSSLFRSA